MDTLLRIGFKEFLYLFKSSPSLAVNYVLQSIFFGLAISSFVVLILRFIRFSYAKTVVDNAIARLLLIIMFLYLKVWDHWSGWFTTIGYACAVFMCLYTFDCCLNIS